MKVLFACLGNICRSPTAEGVLRHMAATEAPELLIEVDSAGTAGYHVGAPPDLRSQRAALRRGIDLSALRARRVSVDDFTRFDLILAMDGGNLRDLKRLQPAGTPARLRLYLEYAPGSGGLEVPDPYDGGAAGFERVLDLTTQAARGLLEELRSRA